MESTAEKSQSSTRSEELSPPAPLIWYVLWAGAWLCSSAAHALREFTSDPLDSTIRLVIVVVLFVAMYIRHGRRFFIVALGSVAVAAILITVLSGHRTGWSSNEILRLSMSAVLLLPLYLEALRSRGVEWQIVKESALPALGLLMVGSLVYFIAQEMSGLPPLTGEWIWHLAGTLWIISAGFVARKYV